MMADVIGESLHEALFDQAERVRWRMQDIPFHRIDAEKASPGLRQVVREIAFSEMTTFSATRRFMTELADDVDFSQWIAVWFYEESKHPQVLLRWLHHLDVTVDSKFVHRGRATAAFMKSRMGTLVTNIISEMVAAGGYVRLAERSPEPVLALIAKNLAADEARHAASFYSYAARHLERSKTPFADRRDALKVLYMWFQDSERVSHPVNEFYERNPANQDVNAAMNELGFDTSIARDRIFQLIGNLVGCSLDSSSDLLAHVRMLGEEQTRGTSSI